MINKKPKYVETSSNNNTSSAVFANGKVWTSGANDTTPNIKLTTSVKDRYIESVTVRNATNVESIIATLIIKNGTKVNYNKHLEVLS